MKKILALFLILVMLPICALSEIDLSSLTFEELAALRDQCQLEMFSRDEWQEVTVPQGLYEIGVDIPAGKWTVRCADTDRDDLLMAETSLRWGIGKPGPDYYWSYNTEKSDVEIFNPNSSEYDAGAVTEFTIELEVGDFLYIHPLYNAAVFTTYTGPAFKFH